MAMPEMVTSMCISAGTKWMKIHGGKKRQEAFERMYRKSEEYGGLVSGEHGIGFAKREYLKHQLGEEQMGLMSGIKSVFDPKGILNPGKIV